MLYSMKVKLEMARYNQNKISYERQDALFDDFCSALSKLRAKDEIKNFLKDLMNRQERLMFIRRLQIAELLFKGYTYEEIKEALHVGEPTIARVSRWLNFGRNGYKNVLQKKKA